MRAGAQPAPALIFMSELEQIYTPEQRKQAAHKRAEAIRGGLQEAAHAYAVAITEKDWETLGYASVKAWKVAEFGPDRFSTEPRKDIGAMLDDAGLTQKEIAAALGAAQSTIAKDQAEAGDRNRSPGNARQQAARQREQQRKAERTKPAPPEPEPAKPARRTDGGASLVKDERVLTWVASRTKAGRTRDEMVDESRAGSNGWPISGTPLSRDTWSTIKGILDDRETRGTPAAGRPKNWNGKSNDKRARELRAAKHGATKGAAEFAQFAAEINRMCVVLEAYDVRDYDFADMTDMALLDAASIYDDLVSLGEWHSRALSAVTNWLGDVKVRERIAKLRDVTGRTPEEAETALALAARLEAKLGAVLAAR